MNEIFRVGIIGHGFVGSAIRKSLEEHMFRCNINLFVYDKYKSELYFSKSLDDLLLTDIIFLCLPTLYDKNKEIKHLQNKAEEYRKIVEKSATKTTVKNNNNYTHNNYLNYISQEPINFSNLKNELKNVVTTKSIMYDDEYFHDHIMDNILKDKNGKDKVLCTDINRKNFTYKDENTGQLISDPELDNLRTKLRNGIKLKQVRNELLEKLKKDYENNGNVGKDPYLKFYEMIQKLNF